MCTHQKNTYIFPLKLHVHVHVPDLKLGYSMLNVCKFIHVCLELILRRGGHERLVNTKVHFLEFSHCGDTIGYLCDHFHAHTTFNVENCCTCITPHFTKED